MPRPSWTIREVGGMTITLTDEGYFEADLEGHKAYFGASDVQDTLTESTFAWTDDPDQVQDGTIVGADTSYDLTNRNHFLNMFGAIHTNLSAKRNAEASRQRLIQSMCDILDELERG